MEHSIVVILLIGHSREVDYLKVVSLASGSKGNAYIVESGGEALLIDCGISYCKLKNIEFSAVLITHSHTDHISGLGTLLRHRDVPIYTNFATAEKIVHDCRVQDNAIVCFENGQEFEIGRFGVHPFSIPHDTEDPVGYLIKAEGVTYFHGTDIGTPLDSIGLKLSEADIATLESNHDSQLLRTSNRPPLLIQRIAGNRGHLSNDQACELVERFVTSKLKWLALAHLSRDCNAPHLAECAMKATLAKMKRTDILLQVLSQDESGEIMEVLGENA